MYKTANEMIDDFWRKREMEKSQYMVFMEKRESLIKQGKGLAEATNTAFEEIYQQEIKGEDLIGPKNN